MDVRQLRYFLRVIELKSLSRAAEEMNMAQPAIGMHIRKLEDELHTQLLSRHSRGVEPTPAGNLLRAYADEILQKLEEAKQAVRDFSGPPRGTVRLGTTPSTLPGISLGLIQRSAVELPNIRIEVQEAMNATLLEWVRAERVDFGLTHLADVRVDDLLVEPLAQESAVFVQARTECPTPKTISLAGVCNHPLVMPAQPHHLRDLLQSSAEREGLEPEIAYEIGSVGTILEIVERGIAATVLPFGAVARHVADGRVAARPIVEPELRLTVSLVRSRRRALSKAQIILRSMLSQLVADEHARRAAPAVSVG